MSYKIASPDEYLAITGMGIRNELKITKAAWVLPFQRCMRFSVQPRNYAMNLQAMTKEKLQFLLPVVFTVGPYVPVTTNRDIPESHYEEGGSATALMDPADALMKYAVLLAENADGKQTTQGLLEQKITSIVEGEVRVLVSSMTIEEIFTERELFKRRIHKNIQTELNQFGLLIYNSNLKELKDAPNSTYFESLSRKAHEGATNQARIDVADAQLRGNVGESDRKGQQEREIARIHAETAVQKTERDIERAQAVAKLNTREADLSRDVEIARVEARRALESKDEDLKRQVEVKRAAAELERLRAKDVVKASITREAQQQAADARAYEIQKSADASAYNTRVAAEARNFAAVQEADALLVAKIKEAEGIAAMADAYGKLAGAFGGPAGLLQYMMIEKGTYVELAKANAEAVRGMAPKISVWNTGSGGEGGAEGKTATDTMRNVYQMLPPLMTTINEQTGITLPEWQFGKMAATTNELAKAQKGGVNGE
ncbi:related to nodulin [Cephalotrichum gorgonifer]|uniref:Related to nodulin n=1 Tax=Cephalotrichum gorgonifer TaxID=2041049 RepID=A0AAE8SX58_9PEZI|nr:related to nodulin [Cephalotrichum gorgonifer]